MPSTSDPIHIVQMTDFHLMEDPTQKLNGVNPDLTLQSVIQHIQKKHANAHYLLATGDLTHDGSAQTCTRLGRYLQTLGKPVFCLAGNHDEFTLLRSALSSNNSSCPQALIKGPWQFILLNTVIPKQSGGHLVASELEFLEQRLQRHPDLYALVCLHHHPVPIESSWMDAMGLENSDAFFEILDRHSCVRVAIWGHIHQAFNTMRQGMHLLGSPSTCVQFKPRCEKFSLDDKPPGYRWLDLHGDGTIETGIEWVR